MPNISARPSEIAEIGSVTRLPGLMIARPFGLISVAALNIASGLKPKCARTMNAMKEAPASSMQALMICTQVVASMPPKVT